MLMQLWLKQKKLEALSCLLTLLVESKEWTKAWTKIKVPVDIQIVPL